MVGLNRPDLHYALNGERHNIEYERSDFGRGFDHAPAANIQVGIIP